MRLLIDTHALLWWLTDDPHLSHTARSAIADPASEVLVSAASAWEIATKHRLGKLAIGDEVLGRFHELIVADGFSHLPMHHGHAIRANSYPVPHRDAFDRMLAAQADLEAVALLTADPAFEHFPIRVLW
jgi:PIN domain nuclease of toxin-antitoxin system